MPVKKYKHIDIERERILRHLEARGVDINILLSRAPEVTTNSLKELLAGIMSVNDSGKRTEDFYTV